jgi:uncharacterized OB-fold protein
MSERASKPAPVPTPETAEFWHHCREGELWIQRCKDCERPFFYPRSGCPYCGSINVEWFRASGRASLYSYVISYQAARGFEGAPYAIAIVELAEGPRMLSNLVGVDPTPENLVLDMPLTVAFEERADYKIPVFTPARA